MSVVSSNMVMSEGNPRVAGGRVLLPLVAEPVGVFVPFSRTQIQTREKVEKKSRLEFKLNLETQLFSVLKRPDTLFQEFQYGSGTTGNIPGNRASAGGVSERLDLL